MRFELKAVDANARVVALALEAPDEQTAQELARLRGYSVLGVARRGVFPPFSVFSKGKFPTALFSVELLALLNAGLNVVEALQTLAEEEPRGAHRWVLARILEAVERGEPLSRAVGRLPEAFSPLYLATVSSSEQTGNLKDALARYVAYEEEMDKVRRKVLSALLYPSILTVVGALVLAFLVFYVVPRFARVYEEMSSDLPLFSSLLLGLGRGVEQNAVAVVLALAAALAAAAYALSRKEWRAALALRLWRIPALGERMRIFQLARLYRTIGMLLRAGIPALRAFEMARGLLASAMRGQLARAGVLVAEGSPMSTAFTSVGLTTPVATRMMVVGERGGQMSEMMERIARYYDDETERAVDAFTRVFEPLLMALFGLAVGGVVVLMYMPVFELAGSLR